MTRKRYMLRLEKGEVVQTKTRRCFLVYLLIHHLAFYYTLIMLSLHFTFLYLNVVSSDASKLGVHSSILG